ncbi:DUF4440 domain-containing protein [Fictibacillus iocasae]|uniref:DUF4440 domain-containing protein n=1 Tax=Fictibacillus iocasae TaxID=2715437 RepID=A0ABW2NSI7_9BACL
MSSTKYGALSAVFIASILLTGCGVSGLAVSEERKMMNEAAGAEESPETETEEKVAAIEASSNVEAESEAVPDPDPSSSEDAISGAVPEEVQREVIAVLQEQISAYNRSDLEGYMSTLSRDAVGFDYEKEKQHMQAAFEQLDSTMTLTEFTFDQYDEQGFVTVVTLVEVETTVKATGKRVKNVMQNANMFQKEPDGWKMSASLVME